MNADRLLNGALGASGTMLAAVSHDKAAATFAGVMTGLWMARQIWLSFRRPAK